MLTSPTKKGLLALTAAALLSLAATAQSGGGNPEVKRDPFLNNQDSVPVVKTVPARQGREGLQPFTSPTRKPTPGVAPSNQPEIVVVVPAPQVTVDGIVASSGQRQAIITTSKGSRIVTVGQRLADYRVKAIDSKSVTFEAQGKSFKIPLGQQS